ncbi:MAG: HAD family hydrolase [Acholeplasmatales bacterium]|nr:HAD family hydrolase [Acholeplasmatales bacterium]
MYSVLCDFDGTLVKNNRTLNKDDVFKLKNFTANNHICIVSNSSISELTDFINLYDLDCDIFSISSNILYINGEYKLDLISNKVINRIFMDFKDYIYTAWSETVKNTLIYNFLDRLEFIYPKFNRLKISFINEDLCELSVAIENNKAVDFKKALDENGLYYETFAKDKNRELIMVYKHKIDKSYASKVMKEAYNDKKIVGITDSYSDIDMINLCDIKVAMINGDDKIKQACDYITKYDNNNGGAIKFLDDLCHLK